jgi:anti-sigma factor RsiW
VNDRHVSGARLSAFLDDELGESAALSVTHHVVDCPVCREELEGLRAARTALRRLPALHAPVLLAEAARPDPGWFASTTGRVRVTAALATLPVLVLTVAYVVGGAVGSDVVPSTDLFLVEHVARTGGGAIPSPLGDLR